jgi:hypothetical protein
VTALYYNASELETAFHLLLGAADAEGSTLGAQETYLHDLVTLSVQVFHNEIYRSFLLGLSELTERVGLRCGR